MPELPNPGTFAPKETPGIMFRKLAVAFLFLLFAASLHAAETCSLEITMSCANGNCTSTTRNVGTNHCVGEYVSAFFGSDNSVTFSNFSTTLGLPTCFDSSILGADATEPFVMCFGEAALAPGNSFNASVHAGAAGGAPVTSLPIIGLTGVYDPASDFEDELAFVYVFNNTEVPTCTPRASVAPVTTSGVGYNVSWSAVTDPNTTFQVDESTTADFSANVTSSTVSGLSKDFNHSVNGNTVYYYRVRANSCGGSPGPFSPAVSITVQAVPPSNARGTDAVVPFGTEQPISFPLFIAGVSGKVGTLDDTTVNVSVDKSNMKVSPSTTTVPPQGTTVTVTVDPKGLPAGANTGTVIVTNAATGATVQQTPVSVTLATPVSPNGKSLPPGNALVIPVVTHVNGATSPFQSDVRITNGGTSSITYQITYTPANTDGTTSSKSTKVPIDAGSTVALNDIAKDFFGVGATGAVSDVGSGSLEIRPLNSSSTATYASSRTYATTAKGTFGQFIAAVPFTAFATRATSLLPTSGGSSAPPVLSLQQVAESAKFRTNLGLVEGSGTPASGTIRIFNDAGQLLATKPFSLKAGEQQQIGRFILNAGVPNLEDGRIEITVESETGAVSAYASVLDNLSSDPLAVMPVQVATVSSNRYVVPGMADLPTGINNFHSDMRVYNGGSTSVTVTPAYYPQGGGAPTTAAAFSVAPGEVKAFDNVLPTLFNRTSTGGSVVLTTNTASSLVATGRTYTIGDQNATFGQFIPGVTPKEGVGAGDRPLQILQLEQSQNFRSNLGLAELTGNPAHVKITLLLPDTKVAASTDFDLGANEFRQLGSVIAGLNPGKNTYNARILVQVTSGTGRVTAYGSVIDNASGDPTYVPAQ